MKARERLRLFFDSDKVLAKKELGQNYLISDIAIEKMINGVLQFNPDLIVEIGPGPGALTDWLIQLKKKLILIEFDRDIAAHWTQKLNQSAQVICEDALKWNWQLLDSNFETKKILISNLPYQISSSIVIERSLDTVPFKMMILMFQKEVAQKIRMNSKSSEYGLLSVIAQSFWDIETVCDLSPNDFIPAPKIASRVLKFKTKETKIKNRLDYLDFCKMAFHQKRKLLKKNLGPYCQKKQIPNQKLLDVLQNLNFNEMIRAEELSIIEFQQIYFELGGM